MTNEDMEINSRKQSALVDPITGDYLELDMWFPYLKLGFELQVVYFYIFFIFSILILIVILILILILNFKCNFNTNIYCFFLMNIHYC
jgi:hypothetical protein